MTLRLAQTAITLAWVSACYTSDGAGADPEVGSGHATIQRYELALALARTGTLLAEWSPEDGWRDAEGKSIDTLPPAVAAGGRVEPLRAGGAPASLEIRIMGGREVNIAPRPGIDSAEEDPCGEFSARYFPLDDSTSIVAWPNVAHPDHAEGPSLFAKRSDGELVQLFQCNRLDIYPEEAGRDDLEFMVWHLNHADESTDAIGVEVLE